MLNKELSKKVNLLFNFYIEKKVSREIDKQLFTFNIIRKIEQNVLTNNYKVIDTVLFYSNKKEKIYKKISKYYTEIADSNLIIRYQKEIQFTRGNYRSRIESEETLEDNVGCISDFYSHIKNEKDKKLFDDIYIAMKQLPSSYSTLFIGEELYAYKKQQERLNYKGILCCSKLEYALSFFDNQIINDNIFLNISLSESGEIDEQNVYNENKIDGDDVICYYIDPVTGNEIYFESGSESPSIDTKVENIIPNLLEHANNFDEFKKEKEEASFIEACPNDIEKQLFETYNNGCNLLVEVKKYAYKYIKDSLFNYTEDVRFKE